MCKQGRGSTACRAVPRAQFRCRRKEARSGGGGRPHGGCTDDFNEGAEDSGDKQAGATHGRTWRVGQGPLLARVPRCAVAPQPRDETPSLLAVHRATGPVFACRPPLWSAGTRSSASQALLHGDAGPHARDENGKEEGAVGRGAGPMCACLAAPGRVCVINTKPKSPKGSRGACPWPAHGLPPGQLRGPRRGAATPPGRPGPSVPAASC